MRVDSSKLSATLVRHEVTTVKAGISRVAAGISGIRSRVRRIQGSLGGLQGSFLRVVLRRHHATTLRRTAARLIDIQRRVSGGFNGCSIIQGAVINVLRTASTTLIHGTAVSAISRRLVVSAPSC